MILFSGSTCERALFCGGEKKITKKGHVLLCILNAFVIYSINNNRSCTFYVERTFLLLFPISHFLFVGAYLKSINSTCEA